MKIYNYHPVTGEYVGESDADPSPLEPGKYLIPANATESAPPETLENEAALFAEGAWEIVSDYRGTDAWDPATKQKTDVTEIGKTLADLGLVHIEPPDYPATWTGSEWVADIVAARATQWEIIKAARTAADSAPLEYLGASFDFDDEGREKLLWALKAADAIGESFQIDWTCADNSVLTFTAAQLAGLPVAAAMRSNANHIKGRSKQAEIDAATTIEALNLITWEGE